ncbi:MAG TPA: glycosyltransferase family 2 protein [Bacteroidota bacterium]|nr:glycosyltransferase family 2 protein [Bacteroidota bacterium]
MEKLSVIVVTTNCAEFIPACFASILRQETSFPREVIAVDNASTDGSPELIARDFPNVRLVTNSANAGFPAANNQGIRNSDGEFVLLLNPDTILRGQALEGMMKFLQARPDVAAVGPKILNGDGTLQRTGVSFPSLWNTFSESFFLDLLFPRSRLFGRHRRLYEDPETAYEVDYVQGSCIMVRRQPLQEAGLLDEEYFMYFDEPELCIKLKGRGWKIMYTPDAEVTHFGASGATFYDELRLRRYYESYILFLKKHYGAIHRQMFRFLLLLRAIIRVAAFSIAGFLPVTRQAEFRERRNAYAEVISMLVRF